MTDLTRRTLVSSLIAAGTSGLAAKAASAQQPPQQQQPQAQPDMPKFGYDDVVRRARDLSTNPFDASLPHLPTPLDNLDFDAWRDIRFRPDKAFLNNKNSLFRLQLFHLGHLFKRPVVINTLRDGIPTPIPYAPNLFDYGHMKIDKPLPVNVGFAGFRLHYPLNNPQVFDEVIAFLGASYFRFLGRNQRYGISARGLTAGAGSDNEEFPFFREFWVETPASNAMRVTLYALLDGPSATAAYRFDLQPGGESILDVSVTLFPRPNAKKLGLAPLTSMFFIGENDHRVLGDFRPELHDSDGLLIHSGSGEWIWRPLHNPAHPEISAFSDRDVRGFGLLQRDRNFDHYQDLDLAYEARPSYWVEPRETWGEGHLELVELPTSDESNDNIVVSWIPRDPPEAGKPFTFSYRIISSLDLARLSPNGRAVNTYQTTAEALGSPQPVTPGTRRYIIDFAGGDLAYYAQDPSVVEVVPSTSQGKIMRSFLVANSHTQGIRAAIDLQLDPGQSTDLRVFLRAGPRTLTETWTFPCRAD